MYKFQVNDKKVFDFLKDGKEHEFIDIVDKLKLDQSAVERSFLALEKEGLAEIRKEEKDVFVLTDEGVKVLKDGLPEILLLKEIENGKGLKDLDTYLKGVGLGWAKRKGYIDFYKGEVRLTEKGKDALNGEEEEIKALRDVEKGKGVDKDILDILKSRKFVQVKKEKFKFIKLTEKGMKFDMVVDEEIKKIDSDIINKELWKGKKFRKYNIDNVIKDNYPGKKHFVRQVHDYIKRIWLSMGFESMDGNFVVPALINFDALYSRQDHPARELHDTFYLRKPKLSKLKRYSDEIKEDIRKVHENGGDTGSIGWRYEWNKDVSKRNVLRTHTTSVSVEKLIELRKDIDKGISKKYFAIGRCFRNETVDWKHSAEFFQTEGIVVDNNANFRHLLWYLKTFFKKMGHTEIRFRPAYYPYTELSIEPEAYNEERGTWVGLGGAGMFRPEVTKPLLGREVPVLAWGLGLDRIVMESYGLKDIRELYMANIDTLRKSRLWFK